MRKTSSRKMIGAGLKKQRIKKSISLQELASLMNVDRQYIWKIENGKINLTLDYLDKLLFHLDCDTLTFFKNIRE